MNTDFFICHSTEDKDSVARPLANELRQTGYRVWFDEYSLRIGDSLAGKIDEGLANCKFAIVIISESFPRKPWTKRELAGLVSREMADDKTIILPIRHGVTIDFIREFSPPLADKLSIDSSIGIAAIVEELNQLFPSKSSYFPKPPADGDITHKTFPKDSYNALSKREKIEHLESIANVEVGMHDDIIHINYAAWFLDEAKQVESDPEIIRTIGSLRYQVHMEGDAIDNEMYYD